MKPKNTLILFAVAVGLFAFIFFFERKAPTTNEAAEQSKHVVTLDTEAIDGINITNNEDKIELRKTGTQWRIESPVKDRADSMAVNQLLTGLDMLSVDSSFQEDGKSGGEASLKDIGLETPSIKVKLLGKNTPPEILFGKDAAVEGKMYVRLDGGKTVYVVNNELKTQLQKKPDDFRDRRLLDLDTKLVDKLDVKTPAGEIEMVKDRGQWTLDKPLKARGDSQKITDLIAQTVNAHIETFENGTAPSTYGLSEPRGTISLFTEGNDKPAVLQIGRPVEKDKEKVYVQLSTRQSVFTLSKKIEDVMNIKPNDVRDKHLVKVNLDQVDRIHLAPAGKPEIVFARKQENWTIKTSGDAEANGAMVKKFAMDLQNAQISAFVSDVTSDLPKYGLDKPQLRVTFSAYASENTAESKAGENPIVTVAFGRVDGNVVYARLENEPYVVSVPKSVLDEISVDPATWRDLSILKLKPEEITSIEQVRDGQTVAIERSGTNAWKITKGSGTLNQTNAQSIQNLFATLHAVRWTGSSTNGLGFDKPSLVISVTTAGKPPVKLTVGSTTPDNMWNAEIDGTNGAFIISKPDYETLHGDLLEVPKPAATPSPSASAAASPSASPAGVK